MSASLGAPIAAPPPSQDDESSDSSEDEVEESMYPLPKKPRLSTVDGDDDEPADNEDEMNFGYEVDEAENGEEEEEEEEEDVEAEENRVDVPDSNTAKDSIRTSTTSGARLGSFSASWENGSDDDDDDPSYETGGIEGENFDSPASFLSWLAKKRASGAEPCQLLQSLLENSVGIPPSVLWDIIDSIGGYIARSIVSVRRKLSTINTMDHVLELLSKCNNIVVISGAGVSVSSGIPDFRSKHGIYSRLRQQYGMPEPECMFDLQYFRSNPDVFYSFACELWPGNHNPSAGHMFISLLEQKGKLLRNYSQNIDNLESRAGITNVYQCHGSFATATCQTCSRKVPGSELEADITSRRKSYCTVCRDSQSSSSEFQSDATYGLMKPDIVFFGEPLSREFDELLAQDMPKVDLVIAMGSSLKVHPVAGVFSILPANVPLVLINKELVGRPHEFDVQMLGYCDDICRTLCSKLGWILPDDKGETSSSNYEFVAPNRYVFPGYEPGTASVAYENDSDSEFRRPRSLTSDWYLGNAADEPVPDSNNMSGSVGLLRPQRVSSQLSTAFTDDDEIPSAERGNSDVAPTI